MARKRSKSRKLREIKVHPATYGGHYPLKHYGYVPSWGQYNPRRKRRTSRARFPILPLIAIGGLVYWLTRR